jgi:ATPase components of ABC transporters with duplicated ATPase domains
MLQGVATLSGGEQAKVKICILMLTNANFLILAEPTNHLDADAKAVL